MNDVERYGIVYISEMQHFYLTILVHKDFGNLSSEYFFQSQPQPTPTHYPSSTIPLAKFHRTYVSSPSTRLANNHLLLFLLCPIISYTIITSFHCPSPLVVSNGASSLSMLNSIHSPNKAGGDIKCADDNEQGGS